MFLAVQTVDYQLTLYTLEAIYLPLRVGILNG